ncbi:tetratricopeptide repeat domain 39B [Strigomonas culicis]|uniref:Tetratricopeptide repeat domain 39B n=1 Tax=Strigomonas culicis TaxID=28005 RepID=S9V9J8_9TRYP|nr:tetratricopeptide repeat domain 39B [Strigomonas culicis]|eukprot:EPY23651.1 tetratricopeptide repeat domain 39B [Strigomonas culicis]
MRAILQLMMNSYLKGGINLRKAWGCFHSLTTIVEKDTDNRIPYDIKMCVKYGTGVFYTFLALVPANLMKLLSIIGFISDKDLGEQYLNEVFESNTIRSPYAALTLCTLYLFLPTGLGNVEVTLSRAKVILDRMNERFPNNTYFNGYANFYHRKRGETQAAVEAITLADKNAERAGIVPLLIRYLHADTLFMDQNWAGALERYLAILAHLEKTKEKFAYTGQITLSVAACYVMLGNDGEGMLWIKKVNSMYNPKSKNDSNSPKFSNRVIANPAFALTGVFMLYINRDLAHMNAEQGRRVMSELNRVTAGKDLSGPEAENMLLLFKGVIEKGCDDTKEALVCLRKIIANEKTIAQDSMILPFTYYELAELEYHKGHMEEAKYLFEKGLKIKGDGNETLSNRYAIAMKQLKRKMQELKKM